MKENKAGQGMGKRWWCSPWKEGWGVCTENKRREQSLLGVGRGLNSTSVRGPPSQPTRHLCLFADLRHLLWG